MYLFLQLVLLILYLFVVVSWDLTLTALWFVMHGSDD